MAKKPSKKPRRPKNKYHIPKDVFVQIWETSSSGNEVYDRVKARQESQGLPVPSKEVVLAQASQMRADGVRLKRFAAGRPAKNKDVETLNQLIDRIRRDKEQMATGKQVTSWTILADSITTGVLQALQELRTKAGSPAPPPPTTGGEISPHDAAHVLSALRNLGLIPG